MVQNIVAKMFIDRKIAPNKTVFIYLAVKCEEIIS